MLNEEALILLGTLIASGLLVLGVLDLVWPSRPRYPHRTDPGGARADRRAAVVDEPELIDTPAGRTVAPATVEADVVPESEPTTEPSWVERVRALAAEERFDEVIATAMVALEHETVGESETAAVLWREVAGARRHLGHRNAAVSAFRSAIAVAPESLRDELRRELATWALDTAREAFAVTEDDERFATLQTARAILMGTRAGFDPDLEVDAAHAELESQYWPMYEAHVRALVEGQDFTEAYRLVTEALAEGDVPPDHRPALEEVRSETLAARILTLIDRAVTSIDESRDWDAVGALERAETLFRSATGLPKERLDHAGRRLATGYTRLGRRRVDARDFEEAVDPLFRALRLGLLDAAHRDEARWALVQAMQGVVERRAVMIHEVAVDGNRDAALAQAEKLWTLLRSAIAVGAPQEPLGAALMTTRELLAGLGVVAEPS